MQHQGCYKLYTHVTYEKLIARNIQLDNTVQWIQMCLKSVDIRKKILTWIQYTEMLTYYELENVNQTAMTVTSSPTPSCNVGNCSNTIGKVVPKEELTWEWVCRSLGPTTHMANATYIYVLGGCLTHLLQSPIRLNKQNIYMHNIQQQYELYKALKSRGVQDSDVKSQLKGHSQYRELYFNMEFNEYMYQLESKDNAGGKHAGETLPNRGTSSDPDSMPHLVMIYYPELLEYHLEKLAEIRDKIDILVIRLTLCVIVKQICFKFRIPYLLPDEKELIYRLNILLSPDTSSDADGKDTRSMIPNISNTQHESSLSYEHITIEVQNTIKKLYERHYKNTNTNNDDISLLNEDMKFQAIHKECGQSLIGLLSETHPIYSLVSARVYRVVYKCLLINATQSSKAVDIGPMTPVVTNNSNIGNSANYSIFSALCLKNAFSENFLNEIADICIELNSILMTLLLTNGELLSNMINANASVEM